MLGAGDGNAAPLRLGTGDGALFGIPVIIALSFRKSAAGANVLAASDGFVATGMDVGGLGHGVSALAAFGAAARGAAVAITSDARAVEPPNCEFQKRLYVHSVLYDIGHQETPSCHFIVLWPAHAPKGLLP